MAQFDWSAIGQGAAGGAATGAMMGMPAGGIGAIPGALIGGLLGGVGGLFSGKDEQQVPDFDAAERAREYLRRFGGFGERLGAVGASADAYGRRTAADLISSGVDPTSAQNIASRRSGDLREKNVGDLINSTGQMEAQLAGQLLPYELQREEDQISLRNLQANQPSTFESFIPAILSAGYAGIRQGGGEESRRLGGLSEADFAGEMGVTRNDMAWSGAGGGWQGENISRYNQNPDTSGVWSFLRGVTGADFDGKQPQPTPQRPQVPLRGQEYIQYPWLQDINAIVNQGRGY